MSKDLLLSPLLILTIAVAVYGGTVAVNKKYGTINPYFNQTSSGYFRSVKGSTENFRVPTIWMQDDVNKRVRIDLGRRGEQGFMAEYYFFKDKTFEVTPGNGGKLTCKKLPDFNYSMEISTYGEPNFGLLGRHILQEFGGISADVYIGQAVDGVGQLNCLFYCDSETCTKFLGLTIIGAANRFSFLEYWFGINLTTTIPPAQWFDLPKECDKPEIEYYFDKRNLDGSLKQKASDPSSFCTADKSSMSMVLYRSLCCGLEKQNS